MKVSELIKSLKGLEDFDIEFAVDSVNINLNAPYNHFPYIETLEKIVINDVSYSDKKVMLGYEDKAFFHRVSEMEK